MRSLFRSAQRCFKLHQMFFGGSGHGLGVAVRTDNSDYRVSFWQHHTQNYVSNNLKGK